MDGVSDRVPYRLQCAAITNGCATAIIFEAHPGTTLKQLPGNHVIARLLELNGWHIDHGRWVCGAHPARCEYPEGSVERSRHMAGHSVPEPGTPYFC